MMKSPFLLSAALICLSLNSVLADDSVPEDAGKFSAEPKSGQEAKFDTAEPERKTEEKIPEIRLKPGQIMQLHGTIEEANLTIEWDEWHNRFARAVKSGMFKNMFETINMRPGSITWYHCEVDSAKHLKNVKITRSSGDFWYDSAVINAVKKLDGSEVLAFPPASKRLEVSTDIGIRLGGPRTGDLNFGDVEYRPLAPGEKVPESKPPEDSPKASGKKRRSKTD